MLVKDIALINPKSDINKYSFINYVDTSSVFEGKLLNIQVLKDNYPSRAQRELQERDILISSVRPNLMHNYFVKSMIPGFIASSGFIQIRVFDTKIIPQYLYYFLTTKNNVETYISIASSSQTTFPAFSKEVIENLAIPNITIEKQQHIVDTIGSVDNLIEKYDSLIANYTRILELKFLSMLQQEMDIYYLHQICDIKYGTSISASNLTYNYKYPVYGANGVIGTLPTYEHENYKISISCRGAASGNIILTEPESTISSNSLYLNLFNDNNKFYIYQYLKHSKLQNSSTGSAQPQITIENIKTLEIKIPKNKSDYNMEDEILVLISKHKKQISILRDIKQALLSKYF